MIDFLQPKLLNSSNNPNPSSSLIQIHHQPIILEPVKPTNHGIPFSTSLLPKYLVWMWKCRMFQDMLNPRMGVRREVEEQVRYLKHKDNKPVKFEEWELASVVKS